jgi:serine protease AprX
VAQWSHHIGDLCDVTQVEDGVLMECTQHMRTLTRMTLAGCLLGAAAVSVAAVSGPSGAVGASAPSPDEVDVIVMAAPGRFAQAHHLFAELGGDVTRALPIISGFAGSLPGDRVIDLEASAAVASVVDDDEVVPQSIDPTLGYSPDDTTSLSGVTQIVGAQAMWNAGFTGQGVDVAVIDTGVARVGGLDATGKVVDGPDLSFDSVVPGLVSVDAFGHGTHMAGIIAGSDVAPGTSARGCTTCLGKSAYTDTTKFVGVAPEARIVNVKAGAFDGTTDVSQVIAAIDWVVQHRDDPGFNIRVLNLSFGTDSTQSAAIDPLVFAAEQAWKAGIVVVVAAGNDGRAARSLANPALSPSVIAVGATDTRSTISTSDDLIPLWAQRGTKTRGVDVIAPGTSIIGLRVPGSFVDQNVTTGRVGTRFQRASGTSQATAVVSGLAALILSQYPEASPDQIKQYLLSGASPIVKDPTEKMKWWAGSGSAFAAPDRTMVATPTLAPAGTGLGTLHAARGTMRVTNGVSELTGEQDIFGKVWDAEVMAAATADQRTWVGGVWNGSVWTGDGWSGIRWKNVVWTNDGWSGIRWKNVVWTNNDWSGIRWKSDLWSSARWTSDGWSGIRWKDAEWSSGSWSGSRWSGSRWSDSAWS